MQYDPGMSSRTIIAWPRFAGCVGAVTFLWASFWPTLMPRTFVAQGAISGLCAATGYAIATLVGSIVRAILRRRDVAIAEPVRRIAWLALGALAAIVLAVGGLWMWVRWQNDQRALLGMSRLGPATGVPMLVVAAVVGVLVSLVGRVFGRGVARMNRWITRFVSPAIAAVLTVLVVVVVASFVLTDVVAERFVSWANSAFGTVDDGTADGIEQPTSPMVSGSPESLAAWDTLGLQGRTFVATALSTDVIEAFADDRGDRAPGPAALVMDPIRVYTGIMSATDVAERAELAVAELERTGAFDRDVLVVATSTGTGWIDPDAADALEVLHGGNTAIVSMQYSYLPSWISTIVDDGAAAEAGAVLFDTVYDAWSTLPEDDRPELIVFGLSLGSYGAEAAFAGETAASSLANLTARADGALLGGPTNDNEVWSQITDGRDPGSPAWRPVFDDGATVRFANGVDDLAELDPEWVAPRVLYVQHASDPVTFWSMDTLWSKPEWMTDPRGPDVPDGGPWFPVVTWTQGVFDLMAGFGAPPGHGHDYRLAWPGAWARVVPPADWTSTDTAALDDYLADLRRG